MGDVLAVLGPVLAVLLAVGWFLSYTAVRLDRLHTQNNATTAALDAQVVRRAEATIEAAYGGDLDPASAALLLDAAGAALALTGEWTDQRCVAESELTEVLRVVLPEPGERDPLRGAAERVQLARRFHNEVVERTLQVRRRRVVRLLRLAGRRALPRPVVFDDAWPHSP